MNICLPREGHLSDRRLDLVPRRPQGYSLGHPEFWKGRTVFPPSRAQSRMAICIAYWMEWIGLSGFGLESLEIR